MSCATAALELACLPEAIPAAERQAHFALARELLLERAIERVALSNGYAIRFTPDELTLVARFVANERKCCPFMTFEFTLGPTSEPLWLRMTGPDGTREVLHAELNLSSSCGCR